MGVEVEMGCGDAMEVRNIPCQEERKAWNEREREREREASEEEKTRKEREQETDRHATVAGLHTAQPRIFLPHPKEVTTDHILGLHKTVLT
jgi:hypothetical protein